MESVQVEGKQLHKACFRCACDPKCTRKLSTTGYSAMDGKYFHTNCYKKIFKTRGKYEAGGALSPEEAWRAKKEGNAGGASSSATTTTTTTTSPAEPAAEPEAAEEAAEPEADAADAAEP